MSGDSSDEEEEMLMLLLMLGDRRKRSWVHDINMERQLYGEYHKLIPELRKDEKRFHMYFWMNTAQFDYLEQLLKPHIKKEATNYRMPITVGERLAVTLRFLATGDSFITISFNYRMGLQTVANIVEETCAAI